MREPHAAPPRWLPQERLVALVQEAPRLEQRRLGWRGRPRAALFLLPGCHTKLQRRQRRRARPFYEAVAARAPRSTLLKPGWWQGHHAAAPQQRTCSALRATTSSTTSAPWSVHERSCTRQALRDGRCSPRAAPRRCAVVGSNCGARPRPRQLVGQLETHPGRSQGAVSTGRPLVLLHCPSSSPHNPLLLLCCRSKVPGGRGARPNSRSGAGDRRAGAGLQTSLRAGRSALQNLRWRGRRGAESVSYFSLPPTGISHVFSLPAPIFAFLRLWCDL